MKILGLVIGIGILVGWAAVGGSNHTEATASNMSLTSITQIPPDLVPITVKNIDRLELLMELKTPKYDNTPRLLAFNFDGTILAAHFGTAATWLWTIPAGTPLYEITDRSLDAPTNMVFSPTQNLLAITGSQGARLWNIDSRQELAVFPGNLLGFSPDGTLLACGSDTVHLWNTSTYKEQNVLPLPAWGILFAPSAVFSPDGRYIIFEAPDNKLDREPGTQIQVWDWETGTLHAVLYPFQDAHWHSFPSFTSRLIISRDGTHLAYGATGSLYLHLLSSDFTGLYVRIYLEFQYTWALDAAFSPDGSLLAVGTPAQSEEENYPSVHMVDVETGSILLAFGDTVVYGSVAVTFAPDGEMLATGGPEGSILLWGVRG